MLMTSSNKGLAQHGAVFRALRSSSGIRSSRKDQIMNTIQLPLVQYPSSTECPPPFGRILDKTIKRWRFTSRSRMILLQHDITHAYEGMKR